MLMTTLCAMKDGMDPEAFVDYVIGQAGLEEQYVKENSEEARARLENIAEFRGTVHEYMAGEEEGTLEGYLENVSLMTDLDRAAEDSAYVTMMTLHSAKGLEFGNVFIPGMEENVFPSYRSVNEDDRLEEERRLMYVGITRAKKRLFLARAEARMLYNQFSHNPPSRFLKEIPRRLLDEEYSDGFRPRRDMSEYEPGNWARSRAQQRQESGGAASVRTGSSGPAAVSSKPKLTFRGVSLDRIPGVSKGFVPSTARQTEGALQKLFRSGDRVMHPKFGSGVVQKITGYGADARIFIDFGEKGTKELSLAVAPIVKTEEQA